MNKKMNYMGLKATIQWRYLFVTVGENKVFFFCALQVHEYDNGELNSLSFS